MKILNCIHNGIKYSFEFLEESGIIYVIKGGELAYDMFISKNKPFCSCPGYRYRNNCWHVNEFENIKLARSVKQPWAKWAEEAGIMRIEQLNRRRK
jgi:hypothetical protein